MTAAEKQFLTSFLGRIDLRLPRTARDLQRRLEQAFVAGMSSARIIDRTLEQQCGRGLLNEWRR